ncbi:lysophospholipid acyltransferase family protein [uncultured Rhodoblastus sp.]|uniref:lysophospholipid acyltransferase family protein n=1 Tax=uncultured Rhodoblastus sp. TaxID=543037 RepID=UPI0025EF0018|nr:lysophospholipid acyltransferase family protein [uncultured Rhodoblastus sp.]
MLILRSLLFNIAFYVNLTVIMIGGLPTMLFSRARILDVARVWAHSSLWLLDKICGLKVEFRGHEHLQSLGDRGFIIAAKHQSAWETFALLTQMRDFTFIVKRELTQIPLFGLYLSRSNQIAIDRASRSAALRDLIQQAGAAIAEGRAIFIFPEGTRRAAGAPPHYKSGVTHLYAATGAPCLPAALNSGLFWPRRTFIRRPGTVVIEFLPPIEAGLPNAEFAGILQERIETATGRLIAEALAKDPSLAVNLEKSDAAAAGAA